MDSYAAAVGFSGTTGASDSLDWLKSKLAGLHQPSPDPPLPFLPNWGNGIHRPAVGGNTASENTPHCAVGDSLHEQFPSRAQVISPSGGVQSAFIPFKAPMAATPLASSLVNRDAPALQPLKRIRLFGSWVEPAAVESDSNEGLALGVQQGGSQEQQGGSWKQQLPQPDEEPHRDNVSPLEEKEQLKWGPGVGAQPAPFATDWNEEKGAVQTGANPRSQWHVTADSERQVPQGGCLESKTFQGGGDAGRALEQRPSGEKGELAKLKLHFGPNDALLYGGPTDPVAGGFGLFRADAAYLKRKQAPQQAAEKPDEGGAKEKAKGGSDDGWFDLAKETTGGGINIFDGDLRPPPTVGPEATRAAAQRTGARNVLPFQLYQLITSGGWGGFEGVKNSRSRPAPQADANEQQDGRSSACIEDTRVGARGPKSRADWMAEQAAHELLTLALAQRSEEEAPWQGLSAAADPKAASLLASQPPKASLQRTGSLNQALGVAPVSANSSSSEDDQPLAHRQGAGATLSKPPKGPPHANRLSLATEGGHLQTVPAGLLVAENEGAGESDDRCNYHSGKAKKGWRCKNPKLKGFKICVFHRKQRLDRRQMNAAASAAAKPFPEPNAPPSPQTKPPKFSPINAIACPPKKRPHAYLEFPPGWSEPSPEESDKPLPRRKRRSLPKPRTRLGSDGEEQAIEDTDSNRKRGVQSEEVPGGGNEEREETQGVGTAAEGAPGVGLPSPAPEKELADEERCTYRSGAQGKWRCKRPRHASFKFCQFHRESQKKYWDKKNQARRMLDKKKS